MQTIIDSMQLKQFAAGVNIITQGEIGEKYYILRTGKCEVIINNESANDGPRALLERAAQ